MYRRDFSLIERNKRGKGKRERKTKKHTKKWTSEQSWRQQEKWMVALGEGSFPHIEKRSFIFLSYTHTRCCGSRMFSSLWFFWDCEDGCWISLSSSELPKPGGSRFWGVLKNFLICYWKSSCTQKMRIHLLMHVRIFHGTKSSSRTSQCNYTGLSNSFKRDTKAQ